MTGQELFDIWAPTDSAWSQWVSPPLFAQIECTDRGVEASFGVAPPKWTEENARPDRAVIIDLPGDGGVRLAMLLAERGYRPVPVINASPGPLGLKITSLPQHTTGSPQSTVVLDMTSLVREVCVGTEMLRKLSFAPDAPPVFILDALRLMGTNPIRDDMFDNRWMVFPQDFPSARFLAHKGVKQVTLVQTEKTQPLEDLSHVLLRWQEAGIEILARSNRDTEAPSKITIGRPSRFKASWYRALATLGLRRSSVGGFGSFIPETSAAG